MSTFNFPHYNTILKAGWNNNPHLIFKPCALQLPYDSEQGWPLDLPHVPHIFTPEHVILIHFQDSLTYKNGVCLELQKIEEVYGKLEKIYKKPILEQVIVIVEDMDLNKIYNGPIGIIWFPTFVYETMYQMQVTKPRWDHYSTQPATKKWQCLNGIPKDFRKKVAYYLLEHFDTENDGVLSLSNYIPLPRDAYNDVYHGKGNDNPDNFLMLEWVYANCGINIVCETIYDHNPGILTEKTLFAFLAGQVPIVIAHKGFVHQLEDMGFDMFRDIVDHGYDEMPNSKRWFRAIEDNKELLNTGINREQLKERLEYNKQHALHHWPIKLIDWYLFQLGKYFKILDIDHYLYIYDKAEQDIKWIASPGTPANKWIENSQDQDKD